ncbi:MAG: putative Serine/threonine-protein phosphatase 2A 65 kDa regulatory subunit A [Streblomastix strix]|uniref:Putative Serine/threonine-protein phosphatase 2A 65 kDa regulatory subunit A n=2 Tax=Streblomastix strix TaxID=222440 RepID=A0A5J4X2M0_9EUKA|nr:MAG: putative Serine/threonine-protein phosphatase 2A 65 kDa regulatory subunit A [Streblomastix strix]
MSGAAEPAQEENFSVPLLLGDLRSEVFEHKLGCAKRLSMISLAIGPERTRNELLTLISDFFDVEDEVLCVVAEELGNIVPFIGGPQFYKYILTPLEKLCTVEEICVTEKSVASISLMIHQSTEPTLEAHFMDLLNRIQLGEWYTAKVSACALIPFIYKIYPIQRDELIRMFNLHAQDATPMIRQAVAKNLVPLIALFEPPAIVATALPLMKKLAEDELDVVRINVANVIIALMKQLSPDDISNSVIPSMKVLAGDKSWRVRQRVASLMKDICQLCKGDVLCNDAINIIVRLLKDDESEVRVLSIQQLPLAAAIILPVQASGAQQGITTSPAVESLFYKEITPILRNLIHDDIQRVREAAAATVALLSPVYKKEKTVSELIPIAKDVLQNEETPEVRFAFLTKVDQLLSVIESGAVSDLLRQHLEPLATDRQWRIRQSVLLLIPILAKIMPPDFFNTANLLKISLNLLGDSVFAVRESACSNLKELTIIMGEQWAKTVLIPNITKIAAEKNYLYRMTTLFAVQSLSTAFSGEDIESNLLPIINPLVRDNVPNIRFNLARTLRHLADKLSSDVIKTKIQPVLEHLLLDKDKDVKFFAQQALQELNQK